MPAQFGSGSILNVTRDIFQAFLMAAQNPRQMMTLFKRGEGDCITLTFESKPTTVRLPVLEDEGDFYKYIRRQLEELCACESLLSRRKQACTKCPNNQQPQSTNNEGITTLQTGEKRKSSAAISQQTPTNISNNNKTASAPVSQSQSKTAANPTSTTPTPAKQPRKSLPGE